MGVPCPIEVLRLLRPRQAPAGDGPVVARPPVVIEAQFLGFCSGAARAPIWAARPRRPLSWWFDADDVHVNGRCVLRG